MIDIYNDERLVLTLDAGGTIFVFNAIQKGESLLEPIRMPSGSNNLEACLKTITRGFEAVKLRLDDNPVAISFAFPCPADYPNGIIGDLPNFPSFKRGAALGPMLEEQFNMPVFIQNDGDFGFS
ncbi:hypothetical protein ES705_36828 [subsurface metagenome]